MLLPLLQDCQATIKADRGGLGEFLKSQTKLDDRCFNKDWRLWFEWSTQRLSESLESVLEKDYKASEKTERDIDNIMREFKRIGKERLGVVQKTSDDVGTAAEKALNASAELTYRQRKYLRESSTLQKQAKRAGGPSQEVDDIRDLVSDGAKGTSRWVKETEAENSKKFSDVARKEAEKLKKYISLRSVVSSGIEETNAAKMEWDKTLDAICRPFLTDILSTRQVVASTRAMLESFETNTTNRDEVVLGHGLGRATLLCEDCEEEEQEEQEEEEEQEVAEEIAEVPEFPSLVIIVKRGDSVFSVASKFRIDSLAASSHGRLGFQHKRYSIRV